MSDEWQYTRTARNSLLAYRNIDNDRVEIQLSQGRTTTVDAAVFDVVRVYRWYAHQWKYNTDDGEEKSLWYALTTVNGDDPDAMQSNGTRRKRKQIWMHRLVANCPGDKIVDHIDGNGLNNCRSNLRVGETHDNMRNKAMYRNNKSGKNGVTERPERCAWIAKCNSHGRQHSKQFKYQPLGSLTRDAAFAAACAYRDEFDQRLHYTNGVRTNSLSGVEMANTATLPL